MSPDSPHHGKAWGFRQGCRCDDCKLAWSRKNKAWALRSHRNGGRTTVDVAEVREHLEVVLERMSQRAVGDIIGSSPGYVGRIARGDIKRVGIERARALLDIDPFAEVTGKARVSSVGAVNRLRALTAIGYSTARLSAETGYSLTNVKMLLRGERDEITGDADARIRREYERLSMRLPIPADHHERGGITRARRRAQIEGWPPPLALDNPADPAEEPKGTEREPSFWSRDDLVAEYEHLRSAGVSIHTAASQLGVSVGAIEKAVERARKAAAP